VVPSDLDRRVVQRVPLDVRLDCGQMMTNESCSF
jgi:hypothetical protein